MVSMTMGAYQRPSHDQYKGEYLKMVAMTMGAYQRPYHVQYKGELMNT